MIVFFLCLHYLPGLGLKDILIKGTFCGLLCVYFVFHAYQQNKR